MSFLEFTRRNLVKKLGLAGLAGAATSAFSSSEVTSVERTLDFTKPEDNLIGVVKMSGSLEEEDVPHWYYGTIYGLVDGSAPQPLYDLEGSEISYFIRQPDGAFHSYINTISYFRDYRTREILQTFDNPYTGETNEVKPNYIEGGGRYLHYSVGGIRISGTLDIVPDKPLLMKWTELGDHTMVNTERSYPPGVVRGEAQAGHCPTRELHNPNIPKVINAFGAPTYMAAWPKWMNMEGHEGRVIWSVVARKIARVEDYPSEFLGLLEKNYPEKLTAKPSA